MRFSRQILAAAILALYAAQVMGGQTVHLWQCSARGNSPCDAPAPACHHHADDEQPHDEGSPSENQRHDASTCWVCQLLGQARDKPIELTLTASTAVAAATVAALPDFYPSPSRSGFQSRAPPMA